MKARTIRQILTGTSVMEGAGVPVRRYFDHTTVEALDPFLMLDVIHFANPRGHLDGFPWHPHAGQATFSYLFAGEMEHQDSMGNRGVVGPEGVQYMEAASGLKHSEMPRLGPDGLWGIQLWINMLHADRAHPPAYWNLPRENIPCKETQGVIDRVVAGPDGAIAHASRGLCFHDIRMAGAHTSSWDTPESHRAWVFLLKGSLSLGTGQILKEGELAVLGSGDCIQASSTSNARFLLVTAEPTQEPVFWYGPFVSRSRKDLQEVLSLKPELLE